MFEDRLTPRYIRLEKVIRHDLHTPGNIDRIVIAALFITKYLGITLRCPTKREWILNYGVNTTVSIQCYAEVQIKL